MGLPKFLRDIAPWLASHSTKVWLSCSTLAAASFLAIGLLALLAARADAEYQADKAASNIAAIVERDIARSVETFDLALKTAISGLQVPGVWELSPQIRNLVLFDRASSIKYLSFINVLDESGDVIADPQPPPHASNWASRDYFMVHRRDASLGIYVSRPFSTATEDYAGIAVSRRISHADGTFAGVGVAAMRLAYVRELFSRLALGAHSSVTLFRNDGVVLMRLPFDRNDIGHTLDPDSAFSGIIRTGASRTAIVDPLDHIPRRFAVRPIGDLPLIVSVGQSSEDFGAAWQNWLTALLVAGVMLLLVSMALTVTLQRELWRREAAERDSKRKSEFLATTTHELRTPLHSMLGNADQLRASGNLGEVDNRHLTAIVSAGEQLRGVIDQTLDYLRIENHALRLRMSSVNMQSILEECRTFFESTATAKGIVLRFILTPEAPEHFVTDYGILRQILMNLLSNAIKFTAKGEVSVEVDGSAERIWIEVKDAGCGIPAEQHHKLFVDFERLGAEKSGIEGNGLGLAISRRLVNALGGDIGHRDNIGGGSVFWFALPVSVVAEVATQPDQSAAPLANRSLSLLLVDDASMNLDLAFDILRGNGHRVTKARDGKGAVQLAGANDFDIVLMDMRMEGMDGLEATRQIQAIAGPRGRVPIVAVTANATDEHVEQCRHAGMVDYLAKPFNGDTLLALVARVAAHYPVAQPVEPAAFDAGILAQLEKFIGTEAIEQNLRLLSSRILALLARFSEPNVYADTDALIDIVHELTGSAGTYGFAALSVAARKFEMAMTIGTTQAEATADLLLEAARAALVEVRRLTSRQPVGAA